MPGTKNDLLAPGISRLSTGASLPTVTSSDCVEMPPLPSFTVNVALYRPVLASVSCASWVLMVLANPFLEVIFHE
ncbi:hypothetical protein D3C86_1938960 [compost metagenome]